MAYNVEIVQQAEEQLTAIVRSLWIEHKNKRMVSRFLNELWKSYERMEDGAESLPLCRDTYAACKGYRKVVLEDYNCMVLFRIEKDAVLVCGIYPMMRKNGMVF